MPKGVRKVVVTKSIDEQIAEAQALIAQLKKQKKAQSALNADHEAIKPIVSQIEKAAKDNGWDVKKVLTAINRKLAPRGSKGQQGE